MQTFRRFRYERSDELPERFGGDVRTPESFVREFMTEFSEEGDTVVDPFAGFGTTMKVAEELGRIPYGIEYEADRVEYIEDRIVQDENLVHGSALELASYDLPTFDLCLTSPPFMAAEDHRDPFQNYAGESQYDDYLENIGDTFGQLEAFMASDSHVLVDVSNLKNEGNVTTLAWDVADVLSSSFHFEGEIVVTWDAESTDRTGSYGYGYDHNYCLVFRTVE
ncbi:DNA methyltransferase [Haladaptatus sp. NG-WS-4]